MTAACTVGQGVGRTVGQQDEGTLATQQVQGCRVGVVDAHAIEFHGVFLLAHHGEGAVLRRAAHHVAHLLRLTVVGSDVSTVHGHLHAVLCLGGGVRQVDVYFGGKLVVCQVVLLVGQVGVSHVSRLCRCLVKGNRKGCQLTGSRRAATFRRHLAWLLRGVATGECWGGDVRNGII